MLKLVVMLAGIALLASCSEQGSYFNSETTQMRSDHAGRLEAVGEDLRVYEFTPQGSPKKTCIFVAGDQKAGLACYDKS